MVVGNVSWHAVDSEQGWQNEILVPVIVVHCLKLDIKTIG